MDYSWRFQRLYIFIFLLGLFQVFRNFNVRVWGFSCVIRLGSLVPAFFLRPTAPPRSLLGPGWSLLFVSLCFSALPTPSTQCWARVWVIGPLNLGTGLQVFHAHFFCRPADAFLNSEPGGGQGNLATYTVAQDCIFCLLFFLMHVILFFLCYAFSARHFPPLAGLWVAPHFGFVLVFAFCLAPPPRW